jgi:hypothetical protein
MAPSARPSRCPITRSTNHPPPGPPEGRHPGSAFSRREPRVYSRRYTGPGASETVAASSSSQSYEPAGWRVLGARLRVESRLSRANKLEQRSGFTSKGTVGFNAGDQGPRAKGRGPRVEGQGSMGQGSRAKGHGLGLDDSSFSPALPGGAPCPARTERVKGHGSMGRGSRV